MKEFLIVAAIVIAIPYLLAPIAVRISLKLRARPTLRPTGVDGLPPEVYEFFGWSAPGMAACGFQVAAYLEVPDQVPNVTAYVGLWINRSAGQAANVVVLYAKAGITVSVKRYIEFMTKPVDGVAVLTNNTSEVPSFKKDPERRDSVSLPRVQDVATLYQVHLSREARLIRPGAVRYLPPVGNEVEFMADVVAYDIERQAEVGRLFNDAGDVYRPTWPGAYVMTWGQLFPFKQLRQISLNKRAAGEMTQVRQMPIPANVRITEQSPYGSSQKAM